VAGECQEHLVERRLAEGVGRDVDGRLRQRRQPGGNPFGVVDTRRQRCRVGLERHRAVEVALQDRLRLGATFGVGDADVEGAGADRGLELAGRALGDDLPVVDDGDAPGELVGLVEVLGREEDGGASRHECSHDVPHLVPAPRVEAGGGFVEEQQVGGDDDARGDVEAPSHATGVVLGLLVGRVDEAERGEELGRS
jgi:hypothetical protein